jgi:hypothetical protein
MQLSVSRVETKESPCIPNLKPVGLGLVANRETSGYRTSWTTSVKRFDTRAKAQRSLGPSPSATLRRSSMAHFSI